MTDFLFFLASCLLIGTAIWTVIVITFGDNEGRRRRELDILHALDDLRREIRDLRRQTLNSNNP